MSQHYQTATTTTTTTTILIRDPGKHGSSLVFSEDAWGGGSLLFRCKSWAAQSIETTKTEHRWSHWSKFSLCSCHIHLTRHHRHSSPQFAQTSPTPVSEDPSSPALLPCTPPLPSSPALLLTKNSPNPFTSKVKEQFEKPSFPPLLPL